MLSEILPILRVLIISCWCVCPLFILFLWIPSTWEFWLFPVDVCAHCLYCFCGFHLHGSSDHFLLMCVPTVYIVFVDSIHMEILIISCWCMCPVFTLHLWIPATLGVMITSYNFLSALGEFKSCWQFWLLLGHFLMYYFCFGGFHPSSWEFWLCLMHSHLWVYSIAPHHRHGHFSHFIKWILS